ncbi:MAG: MFS transporter [Nitrospira sp.]|nr:MFS transporter [Nitrospira sp.]MCP9465622.1 MFS transporter [Nitrospira sp.]
MRRPLFRSQQFPAPSPQRWLILGLLFAVSIVTYIDRVNISVTARQMMPALGLTHQQMGLVFSSFVIGYALFQIPGGWLADRWGARLVLTAGLLWWSGFTAFTAIAATSGLASLLGILGALILVRFLLGIGEAVALPTFNRAVTDWLPVHERGMGIGLAIGGIGVGSAITPPLTAWIMVNYGWQTAFYLSAALGVGLAVFWWSMARDHPRDHLPEDEKPPRSEDHAAPRVRIPWKSWRQTPSVWWLVLSYTCLGYVAYIYLSWFYLYLVDVRGFTVLQSGLYAAAPFLTILVFCPLGGWVTDRLAVRQGLTQGRRLVGLTGMVLAAMFIGCGGAIDSPYWAILALSIGAGWLYFSVGAYWASTSDLSKSHAGSLSGLMNMGANVGGAISPTLTPWIAEQGGWPLSLSIAALIAFAGGVMWLWINPATSLEPDDYPGSHSRSLRS